MRSVAVPAALGLAFFAALHAVEPRLADYDGYFHVRFAAMGPTAWLSPDFPWMPFGVFADGKWVDHQLLFHAAMWPFTWFLPLVTAAHASAAAFAALACGAFGAALATLGVRRGGVWTVALLGASRFLVDRLLMPRTQALSLAFLMAGVALARSGRSRWLFPLGFLFAWTYHVSVMLVPVALVVGMARRSLAPGLWAAAGVVAGFLLHPQSPNTLSFFWLHAVQKVLNPTAQAVGAEWMPTDTRTWLVHTAPVWAWAGWAALRSRGAAADTRALTVLAAGWLVASAFAVKWLEYGVPFAMLPLAAWWRDARLGTAPLWLGLPLAVWNGEQAIEHVRSTLPAVDRLAPVAAALPATDCHVFQADWTDFSELFFHAPQCTLTVGLDPHFLAAGDPPRARLVEAALAGQVAELGRMAHDAFGADWVVTTSEPMRARAAQDADLALVVDANGAQLWRVR